MPTFHLPDNPDRLSDDALADALSTFAGHLNAATYWFLLLLAEFDRREVWARQGAMTCAHWLSWACGIDTHTAREKVRVARTLEHLPLLSAAFARGELSYSKARSLTRIATPDNEADLLDVGLYGTARHVATFVRHFRRATAEEDLGTARAQHESRSQRHWFDDDGTFVLQGRFAPEMGLRIWKVVEAAVEAHESEQPAASFDTPAETATHAHEVPHALARPSRGASGADALAWLCERQEEGGRSIGAP